MNWYTVALFAHIVGVLTLFISMALQWLITLRLRSAGSLAQAREWSGIAKSLNRLAPVSGVLILGAGIYMTAISWSMLTSWVDVSLAAMAIMMALGMGVVARRLRAIQRAAAAATTEAIPAAMRDQIDDPALWVSMQMSIAVALGIVFMMTTKPNLTGSVVVVIATLALGALIGLLTRHPREASPSAALRVEEVSVK